MNQPPNKVQFNTLSVEEKLLVLGKAYQDQTANLFSCNADKLVLREWVDWLDETYPDNNK